jgi:hypothetical protein
MKIWKVAVPGLIIAVAFMCWIGLSDADSAQKWPKNSGELCWDLQPPSGDPTTVTLAIVRTVKDHYIVHGTITENPDTAEEYVRCLDGNAEIVGNYVIMHGTTAGLYGDELIGGMGIVKLDINTLGGSSEGIHMWYDTSTAAPGQVKYDGPVTWVLSNCN